MFYIKLLAEFIANLCIFVPKKSQLCDAKCAPVEECIP